MGEFYVYILFRPWDGSPCYVGKGKGDRWLEHGRPSQRHVKHRNRHLESIFAKAALLGLEVPRTKLTEELDEATAFAFEQAFIAAIGRRTDGPLVNATDGGEGPAGRRHSAAARAKMSIAKRGKSPHNLGKTLSEEERAKLRVPHIRARGRHPASDTLAKRSAALRGRTLTPSHCDKLRQAALGNKKALGHTLAADTRAKIAIALTGFKHNTEARANMSAASLGKKKSAAHRANIRKAALIREAKKRRIRSSGTKHL